jgi:NhaP-type Na+/H+ or K+/H+ antiporter
MPRGLGAMAAMFVVAPLIIRVDNRLISWGGLRGALPMVLALGLPRSR